MVCVLLFSAGALSAQSSLGGSNSGFGLSSRNSGSNNSGIFVNLGVGYGSTYLGGVNYLDEQAGVVFDAAAGYLFAINQKLAVGAGIGLHSIALGYCNIIKLFGQTKLTVPLNNGLSFVGSLNLGLGLVDVDYPTFLYEPSIGIGKNNWTYSLKYSPSIYDDDSEYGEIYVFTLNLTYKF